MALEAVWAATWDPAGWRAQAACQSYDPDLFFPVGVTGDAEVQINQAKTVCAACPVRQECLDFAIQTNQEYGVWGGAAEDERRGMRRAWRAAQRRQRLAG